MGVADTKFVCIFDAENIDIDEMVDQMVAYLEEHKMVEVSSGLTSPFITEKVCFVDEKDDWHFFIYTHELYSELFYSGVNPELFIYFGRGLEVINENRNIALSTHREFTFTPVNRIRKDKPEIWFDNTFGFSVNKSEIFGYVFIITMGYDAFSHLEDFIGCYTSSFFEDMMFKFIKNIKKTIEYTYMSDDLAVEFLMAKNVGEFNRLLEREKEEDPFFTVIYYNSDWDRYETLEIKC